MEDFIGKAEVLMEALPYIRRFYGKTFVVKFGGRAMIDDQLKSSFAQDIVLLKYVGINPVVVHGGGPQIDKTLERMGIVSRYMQGMRVTDPETLDIVEMVLVGKVNKEIVGLINRQGGMAVGLSGKDGNLILARKMNVSVASDGEAHEIIDLGMVGEIIEINPTVINTLDENKFIPVIAPVGMGEQGETYNINADLVAGHIAESLGAEKLILLTDVEGVKNKKGDLLSTLKIRQACRLIEDGVVAAGMIPKVRCCIEALEGGVGKTHIIDGRVKHAILLEIFTEEGVGTEVVRK
ncbi:MAG: acetylglutamate kinase [Deltaproteobacteria bacterium]|nr:acetylglutamate kinase [Deltaproteobacteria bacterium]MCZ6620791.1 acetylglutamate kinase [Deltaproteobacteria bacterium]MCZ6906393.1 acetylglutamate kinase [Deltaproteobacteria bacterium]